MTSTRPHLPNTYTSPPGEWQYVVPETGQLFRGSNWPQLEEQLRAHYAATTYPQPDDLFAKVEDYICANNPDYCDGRPALSPPRNPSNPFSLAHSFTTVLQGTSTLASWLLNGRRYVPQDQATQRASVCTTCVYNSEPQGCSSCNSKVMQEAVMLVVGKRSTPHDGSLRACRICSCGLRAKVHLPLDAILKYMPTAQQEALPAHCWIMKEKETL